MLTSVLRRPSENLGKCSRFFVCQFNFWHHCISLMRHNRSGQQAAALSYHTIFGIVPLIILILLVFQSFPAYQELGNQVKDFVYHNARLSMIEIPNPEKAGHKVKLTTHIDNITGSFFIRANTGSTTVFSSVVIFYVAFALLTTIERVFNNIYHVARGRSFMQKMVYYWAFVTLGPLLLGFSVYASTRLPIFTKVPADSLPHIWYGFISYLISSTGLFLLYCILPNTKVSIKAALLGSVVAGLLWNITKWFFAFYVVHYQPYSTIYGVLGLIPLGVLWIFVAWLIVLFGLHITFTIQHLKLLDAEELKKTRKQEPYFLASEITMIRIMMYIAEAFKRRKGPVRTDEICAQLSLPGDFGEKVLAHLVSTGLLCHTSEPFVGFVPATQAENITVAQITDIVGKGSFVAQNSAMPENLSKILNERQKLFTGYTLDDMLR